MTFKVSVTVTISVGGIALLAYVLHALRIL
jgi:hypothetical protein